MSLPLFLFALFVVTLIVGKLIERINIPWIFSALFLGLILSLNNPFPEITNSENFKFLAQLGMYFLLFIIGFDLNIKEIVHEKKLIFKTSLAVIAAETIAGMFFVHYLFDLSWLISVLVASSFATVGEAILLPILDEFNLVKTRFGQILLGVGAVDDIFEIITIVAMSLLIGESLDSSAVTLGAEKNILFLGILLSLPVLLVLVSKYWKKRHFHFKQISSLFFLSITVLFLFIGIGEFAEAASLGALLAGMSFKLFLTENQIKSLEREIRAVAYGFFVPIFFLSVGIDIDIHYIIAAPLLILGILLITNITKIGASIFVTRQDLNFKKSLLLGVGLCAKFSTSIVIMSMLFQYGLISGNLYSVLIGSMIVSQFIIPVLFTTMLKKWNFEFTQMNEIKE